MSDSLLGFGSTLGFQPVNSPQGTVFQPLGTVMEITPPKSNVDEVECTLLNQKAKDYVPSLPEFEGGFKLRLDQGDSGVIALRNAIAQAPIPTYTWQITVPGVGTETFDGFPKSWEPEPYAPGELRTASISLRLKGASVFTPSSS